MNSGFGPHKSKHFLTSISSTAVTADEVLSDWWRREARVEINGEVVGKPDPSRRQWTLGEIVAHASAGEQLWPGEIVATGTYANGCGMEIGRWLQPGDQLRLTIDGVGEIEHRIV
jgi:2-keto-4-pentenoate hydratase/2-oxohepta-3-ene-1,7-dioic acid hydratase in catechol pathway